MRVQLVRRLRATVRVVQVARVRESEFRQDEGEWHEARLRDPLSEATWVVW